MTRQKLVEILTHLDIDFNVQTGQALNIDCPFCPGGDEGKHCGIMYETMRFTCWKCSARGSLYDLLTTTHTLTYKEYQTITTESLDVSSAPAIDQITEILRSKPEEVVVDRKEKIQWPPDGAVPLRRVINNPFVQQFIEKRKLTNEQCLAHDVMIGCVGRYLNRFIIPVYNKGCLVAFQARAMMDGMEPRYLTSGPVNQYLYGIDDIDEMHNAPVVIVEGIFDQWRVGKNAIASFSHHLTGAQVVLLREKHPTEWVLCWDGDSYWIIRETIEQLKVVLSEPVRSVELPVAYDPDTLGKTDPALLEHLLYGREPISAEVVTG